MKGFDSKLFSLGFKDYFLNRGYKKKGKQYLLIRNGASLLVSFFKHGTVFTGSYDDGTRREVPGAYNFFIQFDIDRVQMNFDTGLYPDYVKPEWGHGYGRAISTERTPEWIIRNEEGFTQFLPLLITEIDGSFIEFMENMLDDAFYTNAIYAHLNGGERLRGGVSAYEEYTALYLAFHHNFTYKDNLYNIIRNNIENDEKKPRAEAQKMQFNIIIDALRREEIFLTRI